MRRNGVGPNENVYAELGSTWWYVMRTPETAAHVIGKLLKYVGENNVVWGTDCLFYGSPQDQIQALRSLEISDEFQERYGYPKLTKEIKAKILEETAPVCTVSSRWSAASSPAASWSRCASRCPVGTRPWGRARRAPRPSSEATMRGGLADSEREPGLDGLGGDRSDTAEQCPELQQLA